MAKNVDKIFEIDTQEHRNRLLATLTEHIGEYNAIGMAGLFEAVFERPWDHRINDTRNLRRLVSIMRFEGIPICSISTCNGGGYYIAAVGNELENYLRRRKRSALKILAMNAKILKVSLPNYLAQLNLNMEGFEDGKETELSAG